MNMEIGYQVYDDCSICLGNILDSVYSTNCGHYFHKECMNEWFVYNNTCPVCRQIQKNDVVTNMNYPNTNINFNNNINFGTNVTFNIDRTGNFYTNTMLRVSLPPISNSNLSWTNRLGGSLIKDIGLEIGGSRLDN